MLFDKFIIIFKPTLFTYFMFGFSIIIFIFELCNSLQFVWENSVIVHINIIAVTTDRVLLSYIDYWLAYYMYDKIIRLITIVSIRFYFDRFQYGWKFLRRPTQKKKNFLGVYLLRTFRGCCAHVYELGAFILQRRTTIAINESQIRFKTTDYIANEAKRTRKVIRKRTNNVYLVREW